MLRCIFVPNLEIVTSIGGELWHGQTQNGVNFDFGVQFELEGHNQSSHNTIGTLTKVFYISGPNLVILAETGDELSHGQARDWRTDGHTQTDTGNANTRRPELASGKNVSMFAGFYCQLHLIKTDRMSNSSGNALFSCGISQLYVKTVSYNSRRLLISF